MSIHPELKAVLRELLQEYGVFDPAVVLPPPPPTQTPTNIELSLPPYSPADGSISTQNMNGDTPIETIVISDDEASPMSPPPATLLPSQPPSPPDSPIPIEQENINDDTPNMADVISETDLPPYSQKIVLAIPISSAPPAPPPSPLPQQSTKVIPPLPQTAPPDGPFDIKQEYMNDDTPIETILISDDEGSPMSPPPAMPLPSQPPLPVTTPPDSPIKQENINDDTPNMADVISETDLPPYSQKIALAMPSSSAPAPPPSSLPQQSTKVIPPLPRTAPPDGPFDIKQENMNVDTPNVTNVISELDLAPNKSEIALTMSIFSPQMLLAPPPPPPPITLLPPPPPPTRPMLLLPPPPPPRPTLLPPPPPPPPPRPTRLTPHRESPLQLPTPRPGYPISIYIKNMTIVRNISDDIFGTDNRKRRNICRDYTRGMCTRGGSCRYEHHEIMHSQSPKFQSFGGNYPTYNVDEAALLEKERSLRTEILPEPTIPQEKCRCKEKDFKPFSKY